MDSIEYRSHVCVCWCCNMFECPRLVWSHWLNSFSLCFYRGSTPSGGVACYFSSFIQLLTLPQRSQRHQRFETKNTIMPCIMYQWIVIVCVCYEWKLHVDLVCSEYVCGIRRSLLDTPIRYRLMACKINS